MKFFWVDCTAGKDWEDRKVLVTTALESGAKGVLVRAGDVERAKKLGDIQICLDWGADFGETSADVILVGRPGEGQEEDLPENLEDAPELDRIREVKGAGMKACGYVEIKSKAHERLAALEAKSADYILVVGKDWTVIPLENLIAELQKEEVQVMAGVRSSQEAKLALETLEVGVDGVMLSTEDINEIKRVSDLVSRGGERMELTAARVVNLRQVGMGDRVCVDTASLLRLGEGMLIGSQASGMFLVHSETLETEYVASRPFRVNAGAVHAYVMAPGGKTRYLSEIQAGDEVLAVDKEGNTRTVIVGRVKIEKRPLILVEAESEGETYKTLLQNAETITLMGKDGRPVSIAKLKVGDEVLVYTPRKARHFGMEIEESIIER
jgi:3-dehydroquinate synthase II